MRLLLAPAIAVLALIAFGTPSASALSIERVPDPEPTSFPQSKFCEVDGERRLDGRDLVGMGVERARKTARRHGCSVRVVVRRGQQQLITDDLVRSRLNIAIGQREVRRFKGAF